MSALLTAFGPLLCSLALALPLPGEPLYVAPWPGDEGGFRANVVRALRRWGGFELVDTPSQAALVLRGRGEFTPGGFRGRLELSRGPLVLWGETRERRGAQPMAYQQLLSGLRRAVGR
ncbi:MAG TPA: hypothetical protein DEA08_08880 [Planctomycetes bacterium]|nr:hypothetical protein [Planctomycetota bacterium]